MSEDKEIRRQWPLHYLIWMSHHRSLEKALEEKQDDIERQDPRGRTPLHLAVVLRRLECLEVLLRHGADAAAVNRHHWNAMNEAVCTGDPDVMGLVLHYRERQQQRLRAHAIPLMLDRLQGSPDFYIEMKWEFSSWVPFMSRMCPSDTYKIWKKGGRVRVDTTLLGFHNLSWQRGHQSLVFEVTKSGQRMVELDHDNKTMSEESRRFNEMPSETTLRSQEFGVISRLKSPVASTFLDTDTIAFQRQKSGIWGFRSDKVEDVNGYQAKVFSGSGLDFITRQRVEHLPEAEKHKHKSFNPLQDLLGGAAPANAHALPDPTPEATPPTTTAATAAKKESSQKLSMQEYFKPPEDCKAYDAIGRPVEESSRSQKLGVTVWLAEDFPLSLQEQIVPIVELMALNNAHFAKFKDFVNLQMPAGFPVRFEIPLFHVMAARVTFGNINGHSQPVPHVSLHTERRQLSSGPETIPPPSRPQESGDGAIKQRHRQSSSSSSSAEVPGSSEEGVASGAVQRLYEESEVCVISDECFAVPEGYRPRHSALDLLDEEDELLQLAIRQSLLEQEGSAGKENEELTLREALNDQAMTAVGNSQLQSTRLGLPPAGHAPHTDQEGDDLAVALLLSQQLAEEETDRLRKQEEEELAMVLRLSLEDK